MDSVDIKIEGGAELAKRMRGLTDRIMTNVLRGMVLAGARVIQDAAKAAAPILEGEAIRRHFGEVAYRIWLSVGGDPGYLKNAGIIAGRGRGTRDEVIARVGITHEAFYGGFVERGTVHAPPHPFMRPAADGSASGAVSRMAAYASERLDKEAAKNA